jgi:hypothetical protein
MLCRCGPFLGKLDGRTGLCVGAPKPVRPSRHARIQLVERVGYEAGAHIGPVDPAAKAVLGGKLYRTVVKAEAFKAPLNILRPTVWKRSRKQFWGGSALTRYNCNVYAAAK